MSEELFITDEHDVVMQDGLDTEFSELDDPVVSETPVFLNNRAGPSLIFVQYPTRDQRSVSSVQTTAVRMKPKSKTLEVELNADVPSSCVNPGAVASSNLGITQTYSGQISSTGGRYAVGYIHDNQIHLSLVPKSAQLRPQFAQKEVTQSQLLQPGQTHDQPSLRSVQMSVKSTSAETPRHSSVLEFWRQNAKEEPEEYTPETSDRDLLVLTQEHAPEVLVNDLSSSLIFL